MEKNKPLDISTNLFTLLAKNEYKVFLTSIYLYIYLQYTHMEIYIHINI